jgi:hypothetical protein
MWPAKFDEWISVTAPRFAPHTCFTEITKVRGRERGMDGSVLVF